MCGVCDEEMRNGRTPPRAKTPKKNAPSRPTSEFSRVRASSIVIGRGGRGVSSSAGAAADESYTLNPKIRGVYARDRSDCDDPAGCPVPTCVGFVRSKRCGKVVPK